MPGHVAIVYRSQIFQEISFTCLIQAFSKYTIFGRGGWVGVASQGWLTIAWCCVIFDGGITKVCAKTIDTLCKIPQFLSLTGIYCYELTRGNSDNYKDIFQTVSISIIKIYTQKKYR